MKDPERIVAEISKNWRMVEGEWLRARHPDIDKPDLLCTRFETVIDHNQGRGYCLESWRIQSIIHEDILTETIIAVFRRADTLNPFKIPPEEE